METVSLNLYRFGELQGKAKEKAAQNLCEFVDQDFNTKEFGEMLAYEAKYLYGIETDKPVSYSLGHCQGDGVAFYGAVDLDQLAQKDTEVAALLEELRSAEVEVWAKSECKDRHYCHWNTMGAEVEYSFYGERTEAVEELAEQKTERLRECVQAALKAASLHCEKVGYEWLEADKEPEYLEERYPDARFTADGKFFDFASE